MKPSVSVIIPYYNLEPWLLQRAITSVCILDGHADWELIVIDDGTPDSKAPETINRISHPNIRYYYQDNSGVAEARNIGIALATKEYILFLDADDYLFTSPLVACMALLRNEHPDMLSFNHLCTESNAFTDRPCTSLPVKFRGTGCDYMAKHTIHGNPWHFFFRKDMAHGLEFPRDIYHEDEEFAANIYLRPQKLIVTSAIIYAYYQRPESRMHQTDTEQIKKHYTDFCSVIFHLQDLFPTLPHNAQRALTRRIETLTSALLYLLIVNPLEKEFISAIIDLLRKKGLYPLRLHPYTWPHTAICLATFRPSSLFFTKKVFSRLQKNKYLRKITSIK